MFISITIICVTADVLITDKIVIITGKINCFRDYPTSAHPLSST